MNRAEKQRRLAQAAQTLAFAIEHGTKPFFGNEGVTLYKDGSIGDIVGRLFVDAGVPMPKVTEDVTDPKEGLALVLGVAVADLPVRLQVATNELAVAGDDTKRSYARRIPKLVKLLGNFAKEVTHPIVSGTGAAVTLPAPKYAQVGKQL